VILRLQVQLDEALVAKDRLQLELDRCQVELKRTRLELAMCDERKQESEQCYRNEIKYLIDKLLKAKSKLQTATLDVESGDEPDATTVYDQSFAQQSLLKSMRSRMSALSNGGFTS